MTILILVVLGLALGSFVNALVWRLRQQELASKKPKAHKVKSGTKSKTLNVTNFKPSTSKNEFSILSGRSMCPHCHHTLGLQDLIPVLSWLSLRGKCRYCGKPISRQYPVVELLTALLFVGSYIWWPLTFDNLGTVNFMAWLVMLVGFMALLVYDIRWLTLPNRILYPLIFLAAAVGILNVTAFHGGTVGVRDAVISLAIAGGLFYALFELSKGKWIGGGDVKLGILIGFLIAVPFQAFLVLFLASVIGTIIVLPGLVTKKLTSTSHIPFGPFLIVATIIVKLFGASIIAWYRRRFLLY
jgi:prepilin signal peptidase PulO-like enzyme (type II secretory pathway)